MSIPEKLSSLSRGDKITLLEDIGFQGAKGETYEVEHVGEYDANTNSIEVILSGMIYDDEWGLTEGVVTYNIDEEDFEKI